MLHLIPPSYKVLFKKKLVMNIYHISQKFNHMRENIYTLIMRLKGKRLLIILQFILMIKPKRNSYKNCKMVSKMINKSKLTHFNIMYKILNYHLKIKWNLPLKNKHKQSIMPHKIIDQKLSMEDLKL